HETPHLREFVREQNIHEIVVSGDSLPYEEILHGIAEAREVGVNVNLLGEQFKVIHERVTRNSSEYLNVSTAPVSFGLGGIYAQYLKRLGDILGSFLGLILISPILLVIAIAVKLNSRGPLFFRTHVIGQNG